MLFPFLLIIQFADKKRGFVNILCWVILLHLLVGVISQFFQIFTYRLVIGVHTIIALGIIVWLIKQKIWSKINLNNLIAIDFLLIGLIIISFLHLFFVHFNYSGTISIVPPPHYREVEHFQNPYPYFADEWDAVAVIKDVIHTHELPIRNPFVRSYSFFTNLEMAFHSFLSEIFLLLQLDLLVGYVPLTIAINLIITILVYLFLRAQRLSQFSAFIGGIGPLYITYGANLPGFWNLIPLNMGILLSIIVFFALTQRQHKVSLLAFFMMLIFYPPLVVFILPTIFVWLWQQDDLKEKKRSFALILSVLGLAILIVSSAFLLSGGSIRNYFSYIVFSKIFYQVLDPKTFINYPLYQVVEPAILFLSILGFLKNGKRLSWLFVAIGIGLIYWLVYAFTNNRFIIEYERLIVMTSVLITIVAAFGVEWIIFFLRKYKLISSQILMFATLILLVVFFINAFTYTKRTKWKTFTLKNIEKNTVLQPSAPANEYITEEDITFFKDLPKSKILTHPWKGLILGVLTSHYPVSIKSGTLSIEQLLFFDFLQADCQTKEKIVIEKKTSFIYVPEFHCEHFVPFEESREGFVLYQYIRS